MSVPPIRHAVIMAAGRGVRMMPLTDELPKAMAPFNGTTLIAEGISRLLRHVEQIHVTVGYRGAMLAEHVITHGASTVLNTEGHGNCWWVYQTFLSLLDEPVCVLTCDNVTELDLGLLRDDYEACGAPACMLVPVEPVEGLAGDYIDHDDHVVTGLSRTKVAPTYCSGIQIVNPAQVIRLTGEVEEFWDLWQQLIPQRQLRSSRIYPSRWLSIDTVEQLRAAPADAD